MKISSFIVLLTLLCADSMFAQETKPLRIIFDSDMGPDYDDVGALTLLHAMADYGEVNLLATIASTKYEGVAAVFDVLNTYFNRPDMPVAVPTGDALTTKDFQHWTDTLLARYPHTIKMNAETPDAVSLYRQVLSQQPDGSVTLITVGFLTNISNLLKSQPDQYSALDGITLVRKKVKQLVSMAGSFPTGAEYNVRMDAPAAKYAFENFPAPVIYSGVEIGFRIKTGLPLITNPSMQHSPVKDVYRICINMTESDREGRMSWDQSAVLVAVRGAAPWYNLTKGSITITDKGENGWNTTGKNQHYLTEKISPDTTASIINTLMQHQPK